MPEAYTASVATIPHSLIALAAAGLLLHASESAAQVVMTPPVPVDVEPRTPEDPIISMLLRGAMLGNLDDVRKALADGADVEARGDSGNTALAAAAMQGDPAVVSALLEAGANVEARDSVDRSRPCSNTVTGTPARARWAAATRPTGPAPAIRIRSLFKLRRSCQAAEKLSPRSFRDAAIARSRAIAAGPESSNVGIPCCSGFRARAHKRVNALLAAPRNDNPGFFSSS